MSAPIFAIDKYGTLEIDGTCPTTPPCWDEATKAHGGAKWTLLEVMELPKTMLCVACGGTRVYPTPAAPALAEDLPSDEDAVDVVVIREALDALPPAPAPPPPDQDLDTLASTIAGA